MKNIIQITVLFIVATVSFYLGTKYDKMKEEVKKEEVIVKQEPKKIISKKVVIKPKVIPKSKVAIYANREFDYAKTINGNIASLPGTRLARSGILVDMKTRKVLWSKNPKKAVPIASMTKMMTALIAIEEIKKNKNISLNTMVKVSKTAMKIGGSQVYLDSREKFSLQDLLKCIMIASANDATELVAEFFGNGTRKEFIIKMNARAKKLKLYNTKFYTPSGLDGDKPGECNVSSADDLVILAEALSKHPAIKKFASIWLDYIRKDTKPFMLRNHNRLVNGCDGVYGMKTGFTQKAMFCTTVTCNRKGREMIAIVTGYPSQKQRDKFISKLLDWGYAKY